MTDIASTHEAGGGGTARLEPVRAPSLGRRLRAVGRADLIPTAIGLVIGLAIIGILMLLLDGFVRVEVDGTSMTTTTLGETFAAAILVGAIIVGGSAASGRRESLLGGWTRRQRVEVLLVEGVVLAVAAVLLWAVLTPLGVGIEQFVRAASGDRVQVAFQEPSLSVLGAVIIAAIVIMATFVGPLYVAASRVSWVLVVAISIPLAAIASAAVVAYLGVAYPVAGVNPALTVVITLAGAVAWVVATSAAILRGSIRRAH